MEHLVLIFWVIIILLSIISSIAKKKTPKKEGEVGEEKRPSHQETLERLLGVFSDEEQPQPVTLTTQVEAAPEAPLPPSQPPTPQPPRQKQPQYRQRSVAAPRDIIQVKQEQQKRLLEKEMDLDLIRQGIILSEILGHPRAEKPF